MASLSPSDFEPAMKTDYLPAIRDNTQRDHLMLDRLRRDTESVGGNFAQLTLLRGGNPGVASRGAPATLPTASFARTAKATFAMKSVYGRFTLDGQAIRASSPTGRRSTAEALDLNMRSLMEDLPADMNRQIWGIGSGSLTTCGVTSAATTVVVASTRGMRVDDLIDIRNTTDGIVITAGDSISVLTIPSETTFTIETAVTTDADDSVYKEDSRNQEIFGVPNVIDSGNPVVANYGNLDRTAAAGAFYAASELGNSGTDRPLTVGLMGQAVMQAYKKGKGRTKLVMTDPDGWTTYGVLLAPDQRFDGSSDTMDGGWTVLRINNIPVGFDILAPANKYWFIDMDHMFIFEQAALEWLDLDGHILHAVAGKDQWEASLVQDWQLGCDACNKQVLLDDIAINLG